MKLDRLDIPDDAMIEVLKQKHPYERLQIAFGLWRSARSQLRYQLRSLHPDWDWDRIDSETAKRMSHGAA